MTFDGLTLFGLLAVSLMLIFYTLEDNSPWCILGFAVACAMGCPSRATRGPLRAA